MELFHEILFFETVKLKVIISLFETVRLSVSFSPRNLYNSLKSIKEKPILQQNYTRPGLEIWDHSRGKYPLFYITK